MEKDLIKYLISFFIVVNICQKGYTQDMITHEKDTSKIFTKVTKQSEFPGGREVWMKFLYDNLTYPEDAVRKKIQGEVMLQFIVCADGSVCNIKAISGPRELRASAVETLKKTPNWIPAQWKGKIVKSYKRQPIIYKLHE